MNEDLQQLSLIYEQLEDHILLEGLVERFGMSIARDIMNFFKCKRGERMEGCPNASQIVANIKNWIKYADPHSTIKVQKIINDKTLNDELKLAEINVQVKSGIL